MVLSEPAKERQQTEQAVTLSLRHIDHKHVFLRCVDIAGALLHQLFDEVA
jgi:hypothetical protein